MKDINLVVIYMNSIQIIHISS